MDTKSNIDLHSSVAGEEDPGASLDLGLPTATVALKTLPGDDRPMTYAPFDLSGRGNSVGAMLAGSSGKVGLVVAGGEISKLMMEKAGLHLWEILMLGLSGDKLVKLRCAVADFEVERGNMRARALVFDTEVTTIGGSGSIDLGHETLDLILRPKTKRTSPLSLQSPILVGGTFARPEVGVDKGQVALRAIGAVALGALNPFLALIPLIDA